MTWTGPGGEVFRDKWTCSLKLDLFRKMSLVPCQKFLSVLATTFIILKRQQMKRTHDTLMAPFLLTADEEEALRIKARLKKALIKEQAQTVMRRLLSEMTKVISSERNAFTEEQGVVCIFKPTLFLDGTRQYKHASAVESMFRSIFMELNYLYSIFRMRVQHGTNEYVVVSWAKDDDTRRALYETATREMDDHYFLDHDSD